RIVVFAPDGGDVATIKLDATRIDPSRAAHAAVDGVGARRGFAAVARTVGHDVFIPVRVPRALDVSHAVDHQSGHGLPRIAVLGRRDGRDGAIPRFAGTELLHDELGAGAVTRREHAVLIDTSVVRQRIEHGVDFGHVAVGPTIAVALRIEHEILTLEIVAVSVLDLRVG